MMRLLMQSMAILFAAVATMANPETVRAQEKDKTTLETKLDQLAALIVDRLKDQKQIKFDKVECADPKDDPHGVWLQLELSKNLTKRMLLVNQKANVELLMEYGFKKTKDGLEEVYIQAKLQKLGGSTDPLPKLDRITSDDLRDKMRLASTNTSVPIEGTKLERDTKYCEDKASPKVTVSGPFKTLVSATEKQDYQLELLVGPQGGKDDEFRPRIVKVEGGVAMALLDKDNEYRPRIVNNTKAEVACRVFIDGIDMFQLSEDNVNGEPKYRHLIVPPGKSVIVPGWHRSVQGDLNWNAFLVTEFGKGVASMYNPKGPIGTIKVVFANCYDPKDQKVNSRSAGMETARGRDLQGKQDVMNRVIENPHECVVIRYTREIKPQ